MGLRKHQSVFTLSREVIDAAGKASYLIANGIALAPKPYSKGEIVKTCMLKAAELVSPDKRYTFVNISLARKSIAEDFGTVGTFGLLIEMTKAFL